MSGNKTESDDKESLVKKLKYPTSVFFIVGNEFCERFSYYGMRAILSIYLTDILLYSKSDAKIVYHTFAFLVYFFPMFGAMIADSYLGKFKTIFYVSIIYTVGNIVLSLAAAPPVDMDTETFTIIGLLLIAIGTGGIKPCVSAFGGDQFKLPEQALQLAKFFSLFYFSINAGSLLSTLLTPIIREYTSCFEQDTCFTAAFALPAVLMFISIVVFVIGRPMYIVKQPEGNMVIKVTQCITTAIGEKRKSSETKEHWLDHAERKHGKKLVGDVKALLKVLVLYIPLPVFWALFDQQGSGWTFQARMMNGDIGFMNVLPDQMQVVNPLLILIFIPLYQYVIYPILDKLKILRTPLQRLVAGGCLAAVSFFISAAISLALENGMPVQPSSGNGHLRIYNTNPCTVTLNADKLSTSPIQLEMHQYYENTDLKVDETLEIPYTFNCENTDLTINVNSEGVMTAFEKEARGYYFSSLTKLEPFADSNDKEEDLGYPKIRTLVNWMDRNLTTLYVRYYDKIRHLHVLTSLNDTEAYDFKPGDMYIWVGYSEIAYTPKLGGVYVVMATATSNTLFDMSVVEITEPNSIHMFWQIPQYIIITMGEIMYSVTGLEFSYNQAPTSMKSVVQACWLLTTAVGNLLVVFIEAVQSFEDESSAFFLYGSLMVVDMAIFAFMAYRYTYVELKEDDEDSEYEDGATPGIENRAYNEEN